MNALEVVGAEGSADEKNTAYRADRDRKGRARWPAGRMRGGAILEPQQLFSVVGSPYQRHRHVLFRLVGTRRLVSTSQDQSLLIALQ